MKLSQSTIHYRMLDVHVTFRILRKGAVVADGEKLWNLTHNHIPTK